MKLSRRTVLRGAGAAVGLPWLEAMASEPAGPPPRMAFFYLGTGWNTRELFPKGDEVTRIMKPLQPHLGSWSWSAAIRDSLLQTTYFGLGLGLRLGL